LINAKRLINNQGLTPFHSIWPHNESAGGGESLARYIIRASFSQKRMTYIPAHGSSDRVSKVIYASKDGKTSKTFDALDWMAQLVTHIPNKGESAGGGLRYYGFYSNKSRGLRKKAGTDDQVPALIESEISSKEFRKNWAQLIQKIYPPRRINPLLCPKCLGSMKIISFIEDEDVISKILKHLELWEVKQRPPPRANAPPLNIHIDNTARPGATRLPVVAQTMHYSKRDFLRIQY
jgi:hypothetical protein